MRDKIFTGMPVLQGGIPKTSEFFQNLVRWKMERSGTDVVLSHPCYVNFLLVGVFTASSAAAGRLMARRDRFPARNLADLQGNQAGREMRNIRRTK